MIKTFLFDIGNVLVHFCHDRMWRQLGDIFGVEANILKQHAIDQNIVHRYDTGQIDTAGFHDFFCQFANCSPTKQEFVHALTDIFHPNESIYFLVHHLKAKGIRLVLLSNTCEAHFEYLFQHHSILQEFDYPVLSYKVQACKPNKAIFSAALDAARCSAEECFYLDDIPEYIRAGQAFGFQAALYENTPSLLNNLTNLKII